MEQMHPEHDTKFVFNSCLQVLENGMDFNIIRKISWQERRWFVNPKGLYHLQERKKKIYTLLIRYFHAYIALGGYPLSLWW